MAAALSEEVTAFVKAIGVIFQDKPHLSVSAIHGIPLPGPALEDICSATPCGACEGRGLAFRNAAVPCRSCLGLGQKLAPKLDPSKILP